MTFTTNQWAILALVLILGWVLGLASRSGGGRWRRQLDEERIRRETAEERIAALNARIAELERGDAVRPVAVTREETIDERVVPPYSPNG